MALAVAPTICFQTLLSPPEGIAPNRARLLLRGVLVLAADNKALPHLPLRGVLRLEGIPRPRVKLRAAIGPKSLAGKKQRKIRMEALALTLVLLLLR